jgi:hypothetical protein
VQWDDGEWYVHRNSFPAPPGKDLDALYRDRWKPNAARLRFATEREAGLCLIDCLREQRDEISARIADMEDELGVQHQDGAADGAGEAGR